MPPLSLPSTGFVRQAVLIGTREVSAEQAQSNREAGRSPVRPRPAIPGIVPFSSATLWRKVKRGEFPAPVKLSPGVSAWRVEDLRDWLSNPDTKRRATR